LFGEVNPVNVAKRAFENYGDIFAADSVREAVNVVNKIASEQAELLRDNYEAVLTKLILEGMKAHALTVKIRR